MIKLEQQWKETYKHFGEIAQMDKLEEETTELLSALELLHYGSISVEEFEKELSDVINVAMQFVIYYGGSAEGVISHCASKMHRTMKRIAESYYE